MQESRLDGNKLKSVFEAFSVVKHSWRLDHVEGQLRLAELFRAGCQ